MSELFRNTISEIKRNNNENGKTKIGKGELSVTNKYYEAWLRLCIEGRSDPSKPVESNCQRTNRLHSSGNLKLVKMTIAQKTCLSINTLRSESILANHSPPVDNNCSRSDYYVATNHKFPTNPHMLPWNYWQRWQWIKSSKKIWSISAQIEKIADKRQKNEKLTAYEFQLNDVAFPLSHGSV